MVRIPRRGQRPEDRRDNVGFFVAADDAEQLSHDLGAVLERAEGVGWYDTPGSDVDLAAFMLCRLRRAEAGVGGAMEHGDNAVRNALAGVSPEALAWLTSRAISYMDESGYPESVERWFPDVLEPRPTEGETSSD